MMMGASCPAVQLKGGGRIMVGQMDGPTKSISTSRHWWFTYNAGELRAGEVSNIIKPPVKNESTTQILTQQMANLNKLLGITELSV